MIWLGSDPIAHGCAGVPAVLAEHGLEQVRATVDGLAVLIEFGHHVDHGVQLDHVGLVE
jgi:hypothetical protein